MTRPLLLTFCLLSLACSAPADPEDPIVLLDASPDPVEDMADDVIAQEDVAPDLPVEPTCPECPPIVWEEGPALPAARDHHMTLVHEHEGGASLIVMGGMNTGSPPTFRDDVWVSELAQDGSPGPWKQGAPLQLPWAGAPVIVSPQDTFILASGRVTVDDELALTSRVFVIQLGPEGPAAEWTETAALPAPRFHHAGSSTTTHAYLTGGLEINDATDTVYIGEFSEDGGIKSWREGPALPEPRTHHSSFLHGDHLYIVGGFSGGVQAPQRQTSVHRAPILENGDLGPWELDVSTLPNTRSTHANTIYDGHVYLIGGLDDVGFTSTIIRAELQEGGLGPWELLLESGLPRPTGHTHHAPTYGSHLYIVSGGERLTHSDRTHHGTFYSN